MNDKQFELAIKITIMVTIMLVVSLIILAVKVLKDNNNTYSILNELNTKTAEAQIENDDEFKQYLEVFALKIQEEVPNDSKEIETSIVFLNQIFWYEPILTETGFTIYDKTTIKNVARELLGINGEIENGNYIILDEQYDGYRYSEGTEFIFGTCMEIKNIEQTDNNYMVEYTCVFAGDSELYSLSEGETIEINTYTIKAELEKNVNYEYSKYCLKNIEIISKDIVQYN